MNKLTINITNEIVNELYEQIEEELNHLWELSELKDLRIEDLKDFKRNINFLIQSYNEIASHKIPEVDLTSLADMISFNGLQYA